MNDLISYLYRLCAECGSRMKIGGPMWNQAIHDPTFVAEALSHAESNQALFPTFDRIKGMLSVVKGNDNRHHPQSPS
jgi:tRNA G26 N,N-dimethylase Trm1